jgi:hypothetical protein
MTIVQPPAMQSAGQVLAIELRVVSRARYRPHVHETANTMRLEHLKKFADRTSGVADGEDG